MHLTTDLCDFSGRAVLITGGTKGIGLATGLAFGRRGAHVILTHKWSSADLDAVFDAFAAVEAPVPSIVEADVSHDVDTRNLLEAIRLNHSDVHAFISNVAFGPGTPGFDDYSRRGLAAAIDYSVWPIVSYTRAIKEVFGTYPKYVLGMSSEGIDTYQSNYDIMAAAKSSLEALCRYMNHRLRTQGSRVNVIRTHFTSTDSLRAIAGEEFEPFVEKYAPGLFTTPQEVGEAAVGLCSGLMDSIGGQVITVDRGAKVFDNFSRLFVERADTLLASAKPPR